MSKQLHYGVITDDELSLRGPKIIDEGPFDTIREAFEEAIEHILSGPENFAKVVVCKIENPSDDPLEQYWVEDWSYTGVNIDASDAGWVCPEEE
jgi:hypothetical protein